VFVDDAARLLEPQPTVSDTAMPAMISVVFRRGS